MGSRTGKGRWWLFFEEGGVGLKEIFEEVIAVVYEAADDLHGGGVFVGDFVEPAFVEGEDLGVGVAEQDWRMSGDDELGVFVLVQGVVDKD